MAKKKKKKESTAAQQLQEAAKQSRCLKKPVASKDNINKTKEPVSSKPAKKSKKMSPRDPADPMTKKQKVRTNRDKTMAEAREINSPKPTLSGKTAPQRVKEGDEVQYKYGNTFYKATVLEFDKATKKVRVSIDKKYNDPDLAEKWCATVSLTPEQAKAKKPKGFSQGKVNIGAPVAGAV